MINIWMRYKIGRAEKIDSAGDEKEAEYLADEYRIAYGKDCKIWSGKKSDENNKKE